MLSARVCQPRSPLIFHAVVPGRTAHVVVGRSPLGGIPVHTFSPASLPHAFKYHSNLESCTCEAADYLR
jgi:hypothetical protein